MDSFLLEWPLRCELLISSCGFLLGVPITTTFSKVTRCMWIIWQRRLLVGREEVQCPRLEELNKHEVLSSCALDGTVSVLESAGINPSWGLSACFVPFCQRSQTFRQPQAASSARFAAGGVSSGYCLQCRLTEFFMSSSAPAWESVGSCRFARTVCCGFLF